MLCEIEDFTLNERQRKAVKYYLMGYNKRAALREAGYSDSYCINPNKVFDNKYVRRYIVEQREKLMSKFDVTEEWVIERLVEIVNANLGDIIVIDPEVPGGITVDYTKLTPSLRASISGVTVDSLKMGRGDSAVPVQRVRISIADKLRALDLLARYLGMYKDKLSVDMDGEVIKALQEARTRIKDA